MYIHYCTQTHTYGWLIIIIQDYKWKLKDFALQSRLNWFVDEQVEEEENATDLVNKFRMVGDNGYGLYQLDQELAARVYTQASPLANAE